MTVSEATGRRVDTLLLPCIATLLITNSHLDSLYPDPKYGVGGSLGNTLFFFLSGYGLAMSLSFGRAANETFAIYYWRRITRIYPAILLVTGAVFVVQKQWTEGSLLQWLSLIVWPTPYWFIAAIIFFYIPFYWVGRWSSRGLLMTICLLAAPYFTWYYLFIDKSCFSIETGYFKWLVSFQMMCFGAWIAKRPKYSSSTYLAFSGLVISVLSFYALKIYVFKLGYGSFQFLVHAVLFPFAWFAYEFLTSPAALEFVSKWHLKKLVLWMSGLTLGVISKPEFVINTMAGNLH